ncbi:Homoserine kinase [Diplonema papillatum]|nr:Homoserine kinase [Diplonema papillatum]KAJ9461267.1 Homoserine kinase [Diplonema papillatum]
MTERRSVTVRVPATSANLGPGYDVLGISLDIWQEVTVERAEKFSMHQEGEGSDKVPTDKTNLIIKGCERAFAMANKKVPPLKYHVVSQIPFMRGMGSSSAGLVAGLLAGLALTGLELGVDGEESLLQVAAEIEGHPDNVSPAIYGGLQMGLHTGERYYTQRIRVPNNMQCVLFIPDEPKKGGTEKNRALLKPMISRADAVFNLQRLAFLVSCFERGDLKGLRLAMDDKLHQPQRGVIMPHVFQVINAALGAGACGAYLSGAGPAVMAICEGRGVILQEKTKRTEERIGQAMVDAAARIGCPGRAFITYPTQIGAHVVRADPPLSSASLHRFSPFRATTAKF